MIRKNNKTIRSNSAMFKKFNILKDAIKTEIREHKASAFVYFLLRFLVIVTMVLQFYNRTYENVLFSVLKY